MKTITICIGLCILINGCASYDIDDSQCQVGFEDKEKIPLSVALFITEELSSFSGHGDPYTVGLEGYKLGPSLKQNTIGCAKSIFKKVIVIEASESMMAPQECNAVLIAVVESFHHDRFTWDLQRDIDLTMNLRLYTPQHDLIWSDRITGKAENYQGSAFEIKSQKTKRAKLLIQDLYTKIYHKMHNAEKIHNYAFSKNVSQQ